MNYKDTYDKLFSENAHYNKDDPKSYRYNFMDNFLDGILDRKNKHTLVDFGTGRGSFIEVLRTKFIHEELDILTCDLEKYHNLNERFIKMDLSNCKDRVEFSITNSEHKPQVITCLDCLEHLEKDLQGDVIEFFSNNCSYCVLSIANHSDIINGIELHLTRERKYWWDQLIEVRFKILRSMTHTEHALVGKENTYEVYYYLLQAKRGV